MLVGEARRISRSKCSNLKDYMADDKDTNPRPAPGSTKEEVALELMRFIAGTTGYGKTSTGAGFGGKAPKTPDEQVDALLQLYGRCRTAVGVKE